MNILRNNPAFKPVLKVLLLAAGSISIVICLQFASIWNRGYTGGGFVRNFIPYPLRSLKSLDLKYNSFYIAGLANERLYLGNYTAPLTMIAVTLDLRDSTLNEIRLDSLENLSSGRIYITVDTNAYYVFNGFAPFIYRGDSVPKRPLKISDIPVYFKNAMPVGRDVFILKSESAKTHRDIIIRQSIHPRSIGIDTTFLERQLDGVFCTDGMLHYSNSLHRIVYVYFYRNQYIESDPDLTSISRYRTIDTTTRAKIKIAKIDSRNSKTMAAPPVVVNKRSSVSNDWLYIQSGLLADNQLADDQNYYEVIDVYHLPSHQYRFSFYLPFERRKHLSAFAVFGQTLVVLYEQYLFVYEISPQAFELN